MGCIGIQEGFILLAIVIVVLGAGRIPQLGDAVGRAFLNFKRSVRGQDEIDVTPRKQVEPGDEDSKT